MTSLALVACEDAAIREEIELTFDGLRCATEAAVTARGVLGRLEQDDPPGVIVLDLGLPGADRPEFPGLIRKAAPAAVIVVIVDPALVPENLPLTGSSSVYRFLMRPWTETALRRSLHAARTRAILLEENRRLAALNEIQERVLLEERERLTEQVEEATSKVDEVESRRETLPGNAAALGAAILDAFDTGLALHVRAVASATRDLSRAIGLPELTVERVEAAATLHDIGYLGLPRFHLSRPRDQLTDRESEEQRKHVELGEGMLAADESLADVARIVRYHHENFDGTGYPDGIRGQGIPIASRIIRLADLYDRAYRSGAASGGPAARTRGRVALKEACGTALDPELVDVFLEGAVLRADTREVQIRVEDLKDGMVLTRDLRARNDLFIAASGTRLDRNHVERIHQFHRKNPILHEVFVRTG